jgi:hypothetical protein
VVDEVSPSEVFSGLMIRSTAIVISLYIRQEAGCVGLARLVCAPSNQRRGRADIAGRRRVHVRGLAR